MQIYEPKDALTLTTLSFIFLTLVFSAFFSGLEIAFISSNKLRFELDRKQQGLTSGVLSLFYKKPKQFISTMLVGNNISIVIYGLLVADLLTPWLGRFISSQLIITVLQTLMATLVVLITGEFLPKTIFRVNPNLWLRSFALILFFFYIILYPVALFGTWLSILTLRIFGVKVNAEAQENAFSRMDLNYLIQETFDNNESEKEVENEVKIFQNALDFSNVKVRDCFVPRTEIVAVEYNTSVEALMQVFIDTGYSKIPVYKDDVDNVVGCIYSSEMFIHQEQWQQFISHIPIVPEIMAAHKLMKLFMKEKKSIALVVDEFGGTAGIVTLEDIMEEIFGEIEDEHDLREHTARKISENEFLLSGRLGVELINEKFDLNIPLSDEYETLAGYVLHNHQHFPKVNELIYIDKFTLKCLELRNNRIELVKLILNA